MQAVQPGLGSECSEKAMLGEGNLLSQIAEYIEKQRLGQLLQ